MLLNLGYVYVRFELHVFGALSIFTATVGNGTDNEEIGSFILSVPSSDIHFVRLFSTL